MKDKKCFCKKCSKKIRKEYRNFRNKKEFKLQKYLCENCSQIYETYKTTWLERQQDLPFDCEPIKITYKSDIGMFVFKADWE